MPDDLSGARYAALLRTWRRRRRMTQEALATDAAISCKHLSFLETGRSQPSRRMALRLAACLDIPLRERNAMLAAAGHPPEFQSGTFDTPAFERLRDGVETVLTAHEPSPALVIDRYWAVYCTNRAVQHLLSGVDAALLGAPINLLRVFLHPAGLATRILNLPAWRAHLIARLRRQIATTGDTALIDLLREMRDYPAPRMSGPSDDPPLPATPLRLATIDGPLTFLGLTTTIGAPTDITLAELSIETFLPADPRTGEIMRGLMQAA